MTDEGLRELENVLLRNPKAGDTIQGTGGIRKIRIPMDNTGKRGGGRVIYVDIEVKEIIYGNYLFVKDAFAEELPEVIVSPLEGTYLCWIDMKAYVKPEEMKDFMQKKCRLALDYGDWFGGEQFASFVRMNLATSRENVETAVKAIIAGCR